MKITEDTEQQLRLIEHKVARIGVLEVWEDKKGERYASIRNKTYRSIHPVGRDYTLGRTHEISSH